MPQKTGKTTSQALRQCGSCTHSPAAHARRTGPCQGTPSGPCGCTGYRPPKD